MFRYLIASVKTEGEGSKSDCLYNNRDGLVQFADVRSTIAVQNTENGTETILWAPSGKS